MAAAQILHLYNTKNSKTQQSNCSKYFPLQSTKLFQQEQEPICNNDHQLQALPKNKCTFAKLSKNFFCFKTKVFNEKNKSENFNDNNHNNKKVLFNSKEDNAQSTREQQHRLQFPSIINKSASKKGKIIQRNIEHSLPTFSTASEEFNRQEYQFVQSLEKETESRCKKVFGYQIDDRPISEESNKLVAYTTNSFDECKVFLVVYSLFEHIQQYYNELSLQERIRNQDTSRRGQTYSYMASVPNTYLDNNDTNNITHFEFKIFIPKTLQLSTVSFARKLSCKDSEDVSRYRPFILGKNDDFNEWSYKQSKENRPRARVYVYCRSAIETTSKIRDYEMAVSYFLNFITTSKPWWEKKYASITNTSTTTTSKTKHCVLCCQNNVSKNVGVVAPDLETTYFLNIRIDIFMKDTTPNLAAEVGLLCKIKPNVFQISKSSECSKQCFQSNSTLQKCEKYTWSDANDDRLQCSHFLSPSAFSSSFLSQSHSTKMPTLSFLSYKKECCSSEEHQWQPNRKQLQHSNHRKQRTSKTCNFNYSKCNNRELELSKNNYENDNIVETSFSMPEKTRCYSNTATPLSVFGKSKVYRTLRWNDFAEFKKLTRAILPLIIIFNILPLLYAECDQTFVSRVGGPQNGTFSAPLVHNPKNHSRQCLYIFLAGPGQRVEVIFTTFNLRGSPPDGSAVGELPTCVHEYMDIYSEVQSSDPADLINSPFGGRFCGTIPPRRRISMHRAIAISFFTNKNVSEPDLFQGHYRFLNASEYEIGIPIAGSPCSYTITPSMSLNKTGALISPTYPGAYPKDMSCTYQFLGETNQRVRLEFRDFDLFFGGPHCPFDYIKVYDGPDNSSALIGTYCGQQRNLVLYSSESSLFVHFYTLPRTANTQNRGFKGIYEFSESFVKLDFIRENDGIHIRGTECDQKILSKKESTGFVLSPNYPYPYIPKTVCRYFIYGMQDAQHLERVRLEFSSFNIPKVENKDKGESNCSDGYLKIYLKGQETADAYDKFDYELCGNETQKVVSDGPRLAMVFSSGELQGRGFKGKFTFETEYKIPGTAAPDGTCSFTYVSSSKKRGDLNSPRYPSNYPSETNCSYLFLADANEQVTIVFDHFKVKADNINSTAGAYGASACFEDWLEIYVIYRDNNDRFLGRYCGLTAPGPVESPRGAVGLRITLHTDQENVASGFKARYFFETAKSDVGDCGGNFSNEDSGIITSPHYPSNYKSPAKGLASMACNWYMTARPGYKLSINFEHFSVEGDPMARGCPAAVLRMWTNVDSESAPIELCGEKAPTEHWHYISTGQSARMSFTTTDKTIGAQGFRIIWTEIQDSGPGPPAIGLLCESTYQFQCNIGYCISEKLRCDGIKNCGPGDDSDELHCIMEAPEEDHGVLIIISMAAVAFLICLLCTLCHRQKKRRHRQLGLHRNTGHYDSTTSATGLSSSRRHLQAGGSLSGSLHGINSGNLIIPPAPLPPTSVPPPPHICIAGNNAGNLSLGGIGIGMMMNADLEDDDGNDDDEHNPNIFINDIRFDEHNDQLETV